MKRITYLVFVAALTWGAHAAWAQSGERDTLTASAEAVGSTADSHGALVARPIGAMQGYLEEMGYSAPVPFPSRGGVIDD